MFFKVQPGLGPQCLGAEMVSSIVAGKTTLWLKETESNKKLFEYSNSKVVSLLPGIALRPL